MKKEKWSWGARDSYIPQADKAGAERPAKRSNPLPGLLRSRIRRGWLG